VAGGGDGAGGAAAEHHGEAGAEDVGQAIVHGSLMARFLYGLGDGRGFC
jgi:hypothetical protein